MTTLTTEETGTVPAAQPKLNKKASSAPRRAQVAPGKAKAGNKAAPAKKAPTGRTKPNAVKPKGARDGSKTTKILDLLRRPAGVTAKELMKATGWLPHSVRGSCPAP